MEALTARNGAELRRIYPRVLARTLSFTRSLPEAEDAVQDAVVRALSSWPEQGVPDCPEAWLLTVAKNAHRDRLRKGSWEQPRHEALEALAQMSPWVRIAVGRPDVAQGWKDELLRLIFACCHPRLEPGEAAALCLSTVVGLSTREIAIAFVAEPRSIEQRLTRARARLRKSGDAEGAPPERSHDRLDAVLRVLHLLFNEGYWSCHDEVPIRAELCRLAMGLAHSLTRAYPEHAEGLGLLALFSFHDSRRKARLHPDGSPIPLPLQDRSKWDHEAISRGGALLDRAYALRQPGPLQIEAAISAVHCRAPSAESTDWKEISVLYELLERLKATPAVRVNRAFAVARAGDPRLALTLLDRSDEIDPSSYPYVHVVRGTVLAELGRRDEARACLEAAQLHARNGAEAAHIADRLAQLERTDSTRLP